MTYSQKYSIVQFLEPVDNGLVFSIEDWPLHTTLADVFAVDLTDSLMRELSSFLASIGAFKIKALNDSTLGSLENPVHITLIENNSALQSLHDNLIELLEKNGAVFNSPQYTS